MEELKAMEIKNLFVGADTTKKITQYQIIADFLKQAGNQLYLRQMVGETPSEEDMKMFTDEFVKFKELTDKLCSLSTTKA